MKYRIALSLFAAGIACADDAASRIQEAQTVFQEIMAAPDKGIPQELLERAHCVVIVPALKKGAFIVGGQYGAGVATCRTSQGAGWSAPSTVKMEGGSVGLQIGGGEVDVVMLVMNEKGANRLMKSEFTIGATGEAMAGPVGRSASAETDAYMRAEILSYSRSRGLFAGIAIKGSTLRSDDSENREIYGKAVSHEQVLKGQVAPPAAAQGLLSTLSRYSRVER